MTLILGCLAAVAIAVAVREHVLRRRAETTIDRWERNSLNRELNDTGFDDRRRLAEEHERAEESPR